MRPLVQCHLTKCNTVRPPEIDTECLDAAGTHMLDYQSAVVWRNPWDAINLLISASSIGISCMHEIMTQK